MIITPCAKKRAGSFESKHWMNGKTEGVGGGMGRREGAEAGGAGIGMGILPGWRERNGKMEVTG